MFRAMTPSETKPTGVFQALDCTAKAPYPRSYYARRFLWGIVWRTVFRVPRAWRLRRGILRIFGCRIHDTSVVYGNVRIFYPWLLQLGEHSTLSSGAEIYNLGPVEIGAHTVLSQDVYVCAGTHDYTLADLPLLRPGIVIGSGVWIAAGAFIGPGVTIGDNSVIAARAVVVKDVPPGVVVGGNPARVIKPRVMRSSADVPRDPGLNA
jgi:putative colanic acid biosynthesis acetyltransferase WcaF